MLWSEGIWGTFLWNRQRALKLRQLFPTSGTSSLSITEAHHAFIFVLSSSKLWAGKAWWLQGIYMNWYQGGTRMCHTWETTAWFVYFWNNSLLTRLSPESGRTPEAVWISLLCVVLWRDELKHNLRIIFLFLQVLHRLLNHVMTCHKLYLCECTHSQNRQLRCATNPSLNTVNHVPNRKNNFGLELTKNSPKKPPPCCLCFITKCVCRHSLWDVSKDTCKPPGRIPRAAVHLCTDCGSGATGK